MAGRPPGKAKFVCPRAGAASPASLPHSCGRELAVRLLIMCAFLATFPAKVAAPGPGLGPFLQIHPFLTCLHQALVDH